MTTGRRTRLTDADRAAWAGFAQHIAPLRAKRSARAKPPSPSAATAPAGGPPQAAAPLDATFPESAPKPSRGAEARMRPKAAPAPLAIGGPPAGVDKATWQRFRTGKLAAQRKLDLHGMTAQRAFHVLTGFLRAAHAEHIRCVEIVTGRGSGGAGNHGGGEGTGVLRRELPLWLNRPDLRPLVLAAAHPHAANPGSVRLLLRRIR